MAFDIREKTKTITVTDGDASGTVTIRRFSEGDKQDIADALAKADGVTLTGTIRRIMLENAIVSWTLTEDGPSPDAIRFLPTEVADDIYEAIAEFSGLGEDEDPPT